jgi:hypothetical protein
MILPNLSSGREKSEREKVSGERRFKKKKMRSSGIRLIASATKRPEEVSFSCC